MRLQFNTMSQRFGFRGGNAPLAHGLGMAFPGLEGTVSSIGRVERVMRSTQRLPSTDLLHRPGRRGQGSSEAENKRKLRQRRGSVREERTTTREEAAAGRATQVRYDLRSASEEETTWARGACTRNRRKLHQRGSVREERDVTREEAAAGRATQFRYDPRSASKEETTWAPDVQTTSDSCCE